MNSYCSSEQLSSTANYWNIATDSSIGSIQDINDLLSIVSYAEGDQQTQAYFMPQNVPLQSTLQPSTFQADQFDERTIFTNFATHAYGLTDSTDDEQAKKERKRERNRIAARECRRRKMERIADLEAQVKMFQMENERLRVILRINKYREQKELVKEEIMVHANNGCNLPQFI